MSDWDGLRSCVQCGNDTTGRLCTSCAQQEMIDEYDGDYDSGGDWFEEQEKRACKACGGSGMEDDVCDCPECDGTGIAPEYW